jgi:hypothetical protein
MASVRPNVRIESMKARHVVHHDAPELFLSAVQPFLPVCRSRGATPKALTVATWRVTIKPVGTAER